MLLLNLLIFSILIICWNIYPIENRLPLLPQFIAILLVLNKDVILRKIGLNIKFLLINRPLLNEDQTLVTFHCQLMPKGSQNITIHNLNFIGNGYIKDIEFPPGVKIDNCGPINLCAGAPNDIILRIYSYSGKKIRRIVTIQYSIDSVLKDRWFFLRKQCK